MKKTKKFALGLKYSLPRQDVKTCDTNNLNNLTFDIHVSETICNSSGNNPPNYIKNSKTRRRSKGSILTLGLEYSLSCQDLKNPHK